MKKSLIFTLGVIAANVSYSQNEVDALRYSQITFGGTARYCSMAGAFGALGGDLSSLNSNPAGLAVYKSNEISFSPTFYNQEAKTLYNGTSRRDNKYNSNFSSAGIVGSFTTNKNEKESGWMSWNLAFGYNKINNFSNRVSIEGANLGGSSLSDLYVNNANGNLTQDLNEFSEGLAFDTYVIDTFSNSNNQYFSNVPLDVVQKKSIVTSGGMGETVVSFAGNYNDKLYLGVTAGFPHINYLENITYTETAAQNGTVSNFKSFKLEQQVSTRGTGANIKVGIIYKLIDWLRIGAAFHSPTQFSMHDDYVSAMTSNFSAENYSQASPNGLFDYTLVTPPKIIGSVAFVIKNNGLIGIDMETVDYSYSRLNSSSESFSDVNNLINQQYVAANNIRVGGEWRLTQNFTIRAGYAMYGSPYKDGFNSEANRYNYTGGLGFRKENLFIDLAFINTQYKENYYLYQDPGTNLNPVHNNVNASSLIFTFGTKF